MAKTDEWLQELQWKLRAKERRATPNMAAIVERIIAGKEAGSGPVRILPQEWETQLAALIMDARQRGDVQKEKELQALNAFFRLELDLREMSPDTFPGRFDELIGLCGALDSPPVQACILGGLGNRFALGGLTDEAVDLTTAALSVARQGNLHSVALEMSINLAWLQMEAAPEDTARELRCLLAVAREQNDQQAVGMILNNLAYYHDHFLSDHVEAIRLEEESVAIARRLGDKATEAKRLLLLAIAQEQNGASDSAMHNYDRLLSIAAEVGLSDQGVRLFTHVVEYIVTLHRSEAEQVLSSHIEVNAGPLTEERLKAMFEDAKQGEVWGGGLGLDKTVTFRPDVNFARRLCEQRQWRALAVYAAEWLERGFIMGDRRGFDYAAVALRSLEYPGAADTAMQIAAGLARAIFEADEHGWLLKSLGYEAPPKEVLNQISGQQIDRNNTPPSASTT